MDFEHALEALTIATDPLDAVDGNPSLICTVLFGEQHKSSDCHSRRPANFRARVVSGRVVHGVRPRSDARPALRGGRGLDSTHETRATPDRFEC